MAQGAHGAECFGRAVDGFLERMIDDPLTAGWFDGVDHAQLKRHQRAFVLMALGGPSAYAGRPMREAHRGLGIDARAFARCLEHLDAALREAGVADDVVRRAMRELGALDRQIVEPRAS